MKWQIISDPLYFPGTDEERGIASWRKVLVNPTGNSSTVKEQGNLSMYDIPLVTGCFRRINFCSYVPVSPSFQSQRITQVCQCCRRRIDQNASPSEVYDRPVSETDDIYVPRMVHNGERMWLLLNMFTFKIPFALIYIYDLHYKCSLYLPITNVHQNKYSVRMCIVLIQICVRKQRW